MQSSLSLTVATERGKPLNPHYSDAKTGKRTGTGRVMIKFLEITNLYS